MFSSPQNLIRTGNVTTAIITLHHDNGNILAGLGTFRFTGPTPSNPVTHFHVTRPGGTSGELTPQFRTYINRFPVLRWMNGLPINRFVDTMTVTDIPNRANSFLTSYDDIIYWTNQSPMARKVSIDIPLFADSPRLS